MGTNLNLITYPEPEQNNPEPTETFTKFLSRFYHAEWFNKPNYLAVFMHLLKNVNWHETTILFKNKRCVICPGECIIKQRDIADELHISVSMVNRILKYFEEIGEIETRKTNVFTFISIAYLNTDQKNETPEEHQKNTKNRKLNKLKDLLTLLDNIDKIDNKNKENEINFVEQKGNNNFKENDMTTKVLKLFNDNESVQAKEPALADGTKESNVNESVHADGYAATDGTIELKMNESVYVQGAVPVADRSKDHKLNDIVHVNGAVAATDGSQGHKLNKSVQENGFGPADGSKEHKLNDINDSDVATHGSQGQKLHDISLQEVLPAKESKSSKQPSLIDTLLGVWQEEYHESRGFPYIVIKGKDSSGISNLLKLFKSQHTDFDTPQMIEHFRQFYKQVLSIEDKFIYENANPAFLYSHINKINTLLATKKKKSYSSVGQATGDGNYNLKFS